MNTLKSIPNKKRLLLPDINPIPELISGEDYKNLIKYNLIQPVYLHHHLIKREYKKLKLETNKKCDDIQEILSAKYGYSAATVNKIVTHKFWAQVQFKKIGELAKLRKQKIN